MCDTLRVAFAGGMASGKTSVAQDLAKKCNSSEIISFATPVKEISAHVLGMRHKSRKLLQEVGSVYRRFDEDIWVNVLLNRIDEEKEIVIVDDVRFENELKALKLRGFKIIWLETSQRERIRRLKEKYGTKSDEHILGLRHPSERYGRLRQLADESYNTDQMSSTSISASVWSSLTAGVGSRASATSAAAPLSVKLIKDRSSG